MAKKYIIEEDGIEKYDYKKMGAFDVLEYIAENVNEQEVKNEYLKLYDKDNARESGMNIKKKFLNDFKNDIVFVNTPKKRAKMSEEEKKQKQAERLQKQKQAEENRRKDILNKLMGL